MKIKLFLNQKDNQDWALSVKLWHTILTVKGLRVYEVTKRSQVNNLAREMYDANKL